MSPGDELDAYLKARRKERTLRAQLAAGELYEWVGESAPVDEDATAAATWLGDHVGHRVEVHADNAVWAGLLWLVEPVEVVGLVVGWRVRVGGEAWPLAASARCERWSRTYRAGEPPTRWSRSLLRVAQENRYAAGWVSHFMVEDCAQDPHWLPAGARLHYG